GWSAFPAILVALDLQSVLFQFGGITTLGVNTFNMALPVVLSFYLFGGGVRSNNNTVAIIFSFTCGFLAILLIANLVAIVLSFTGEVFIKIAKLIIVAHLPIMVIEGTLTAFCIGFLRKVRPEILDI
ncbi:unnamed protein product, partial [marine sediment metagenome]